MTNDNRFKGKIFLFQKKQIIIALFALFSLNIQAAIPLAKNGVPQAEILIKSKSHPAVKYAAKELQYWVKKISGAELPIVHAPGKLPFRIVLSVNPESFSNDLKKLRGNDGYAVRTVGNTVNIFGSQPKGVLNGVFKILFKNTDIIWASPNVEYGTIFTENFNLKLTKIDYIDIPVYILRGWLMNGGDYDIPSYIWQIRNGSNWTQHTTYSPTRVKYGTVFEYGIGHNLVSRYITEKKYYDKHPEFFPLQKGKRLRPSESRHLVQLCFTNPELVKTFIKEVDERIKTNPNYDTYRIIIEDNMNLCECPECLKPIKLPNGEIVKPKDEDFRSTQFFLWLNKIARHMKKKYPAKRILTLAYFFTETPPRCPIESNIDISFCPYSKNSKAPLTSPVNADINKKFLGWMKTGAKLTWREYFGFTGPFPRPIDVIAMADWRYVNKHGASRTYSEMYPYSVTKNMNGIQSWNVNSLYFWVLANGSWNPSQDVKAMRQEFLKRVYGPGANDVSEFYRFIEGKWFKSKTGSGLWDKACFSWGRYVVNAGIESTCRTALKRAAMKVTNPKGKKMLAALRGTFEKQIKICHIYKAYKACRRSKEYINMEKLMRKLQELNPKEFSNIYGKIKLEKDYKLLSNDAITKLPAYQQSQAYFERADVNITLKKYSEAIADLIVMYKLKNGSLHHKEKAIVLIIETLNAAGRSKETAVWLKRIKSIRKSNRYWRARGLLCIAQNLQKQGKLTQAKVKYKECKKNYSFPRIEKVCDKQIAIINQSQKGKLSCETNSNSPEIVYLKFNENSGVSTKDEMLHIPNGTVIGATWTTGISGSALSFEGDNYVDFGNPSALNLTGSRSISAWIYLTSNDSSAIVAKGVFGFSLWNSGGRLKATVRGNKTSASSWASTPMTLNRWNHVAMTFDIKGDKKIDLYIDGVEIAGYTYQHALVGALADLSSWNFTVGSDYANRYYFKGKIDEIKIFDRALSAGQVLKLYKNENKK